LKRGIEVYGCACVSEINIEESSFHCDKGDPPEKANVMIDPSYAVALGKKASQYHESN
jgi:hypothetical protein